MEHHLLVDFLPVPNAGALGSDLVLVLEDKGDQVGHFLVVDVLFQTLGHEGVGRRPDLTDVLPQQGVPQVVALHQGHAGGRLIP